MYPLLPVALQMAHSPVAMRDGATCRIRGVIPSGPAARPGVIAEMAASMWASKSSLTGKRVEGIAMSFRSTELRWLRYSWGDGG